MGTINFVLIGARNTGKTCYLSVLASHCPGLTSASDETTRYIKMQRKLLDAGELPQATASAMRELFFRYKGDQHKIDFSMDDYDGSFIESLSSRDTGDDESRDILKTRIQESEGLLFFMPYEPCHDEKALSSFEDEINTIISLIEEITQGKYTTLPIPAVICVTKWDRSPDYKKEGELEAATVYLDNNPYFQRACAKIRKLFEHVSIQPVSAFGVTADGTHPMKGKLSPYRLEQSLDYCLNKIFPRYEQKIEGFQKNGDEAGLFDYLFELYDDLKHHKEGKYCHIYDQMEVDISSRILRQVKHNKQTSLTEQQESFCNCIRQKSLVAGINLVCKSHKTKSKREKLWGAIMSIVILLILVSGAMYYKQNNKEKKTFNFLLTIIPDKNRPIKEIVNKVQIFNHDWKKPLGLPLQSWFLTDRQNLIKSTNVIIRKRLDTMLSAVTPNTSPDNELMQKITAFKTTVAQWPDTELRQTVEDKVQPVLSSYSLLKHLRLVLGKASSLTPTEYHKLRTSVDNVAIKWQEMDFILKQIHIAMAIHIKAEAKDALINGNVHDLEVSTEGLESLNSDGDADAGKILQEIHPALVIARRQQKLQQLLSDIVNENDLAELERIVAENWAPGFTDDEKSQIAARLQNKFESYENQGIPSIQQKLNSSDNIRNIRDKLKKLSQATLAEIFSGDENEKFIFRYQRPMPLQKKIFSWKEKLADYEHTLDKGIKGYVTFIRDDDTNDKNNPLDFTCSSDPKIMIDKKIKLLDDSDKQEPCFNNKLQWKIRVLLKKGMHSISVTEHNYVSSNKKWSGSFNLTESDIFTFINKGQVIINMGSYSLALSKQ